MKIALYVHCFFPAHFYGTEAYTLAIAKEMQARGHDVTVVTAVLTGEPAQPGLIEERGHDGLKVISIDKNLFPNRRVRDTFDQPALRHVHERILRKLQPDIVHVCHLISHTSALLDVTRALNIPTFATLTDFFGICFTNRLEAASGALCVGPDAARVNCIDCFLKAVGTGPGSDPLARQIQQPLVRTISARALALAGRRWGPRFDIKGFAPYDIMDRPDHLRAAMGVYRGAIAPSRFLQKAYEENGFPAPLSLSHFGIEIDRTSKPPSPDPSQIRLGFIGQLVPHKGAHILIDAFRQAARPNLSLTIWGPADQDRGYFEQLKASADGLPITFPGTLPQSALARALGEMDYLVIPSTWYENSPLILLQALATHTPPIISDVLGMTEFVAHGESGFHFPRGNREALAGLLGTVADDPELARRMSAQAAYPRTSAHMAQDVLDLYAAHGLGPGAAPPHID